jgi:hypothetical protein
MNRQDDHPSADAEIVKVIGVEEDVSAGLNWSLFSPSERTQSTPKWYERNQSRELV